MKSSIFSPILFITIAVCSGQKSEYSVYYDESVSLLEELQTLIPEARAELAAIIPPVRCQQKSSATKDIPLGIKCLDQLAPRLVALVPKYYPYPKLLLLLNYSGVAVVKNKFILSQGVGTTVDIDISYRGFTGIWRKAVEDLRSTKGTYLDNIYNSAIYFKNLCQQEIRPNCNAKCTN